MTISLHSVQGDMIPLISPDTSISFEQGDHGETILVISLANLTTIKIDHDREIIAIDNVSGQYGGPMRDEWSVLDLRHGTYGDFHQLRPQEECFDGACTDHGQVT